VSRVRGFQFAVLVAASSSVSAQIGGGHSGTSTEWSFGGRIAFDELNAFGECFASRQTQDALKLVATDPASADEARVYKALFSKEQFCLGNLSGLSVPWKLVRGAVGEGFYAKRMPLPPAFVAPQSMPPEKVQSVMDAAICYAGKHPADARKLVETTRPATQEENAAIEALWLEFKACLPPNMPAGFQIENIMLRYRIAEAMWRLGLVHS
jgi:hypothetical protein